MFEFDCQKMNLFEFVHCSNLIFEFVHSSIKWGSTHRNYLVIKSLNLKVEYLCTQNCFQNLACHADEILLLFKVHKIPINGVYTEDDEKTSAKLLEMWTDFVKTSNPTPKSKLWTKMSAKDPKWLWFDANHSKMVSMKTDKIKNWMDLYAKYPPSMYYTFQTQCPTIEGSSTRNEL